MDLSVLIPVRNGGAYLADALTSTLSQCGMSLQVIVVDDGSTDGSAQYLSRLSSSDPRLHVFLNEGRGLVDALNFGLSKCDAPIVARMDADDVSEPNRFLRQLKFLRDNPNCIAVGSCALNIDESGRVVSELSLPLTHEAIKRHLGIGCPLLHPSVMFRKDAIQSIGGYRRLFVAAEDFDLWCRAVEIGKLANLPTKLIRYRIHQNSVTGSKITQLALTSTYARYCMAERSQNRPDPAEHTIDPINMATIEKLGPRWVSQYASYLLYMLNGRQNATEVSEEVFQMVRNYAHDYSIPIEARRSAFYSLLHSKAHRARTVMELSALQPLAFACAIPFLTRIKLKQ